MSSPTVGGVELEWDGANLRSTVADLLGQGTYGATAIEKTRAQAAHLLSEVVRAYAQEFGPGEVGKHGSGAVRTSEAHYGKTGQAPTGLLYGRVQSGKTLAMMTFSALALDNGFRVVIVLTTNFLKLVRQTAERFEAIEGPLVRASTSIETWADDVDNVRSQMGPRGVVFICAKDPKHLMTLVKFLNDAGASRYPAVILDDEADQATPDTSTSARSRGGHPPSSTVHRRTVRNEVEPEQSVREAVPNNVFVQVTATPYALLLQNVGDPLRPSFTCLLEPGEGYTGGEAFFSPERVEGPTPPIVFVDEAESQHLLASDELAPLGLERAITCFLLSAAAQNVLERPRVGQNFLCHTSMKMTEHRRVAGIIRRYVNRIVTELPGVVSGAGESAIRFVEAHRELAKTIGDLPPLAVLVADLVSRLPRRNIFEINSNSDVEEYPRAINFLVGGNILGRGITIENLLVTYYLRAAKISQMDTVLQHARMFGYRSKILRYTRLFSPQSLVERFAAIHEAEQELRALLAVATPEKPIAVVTPHQLRPSRANVLDTRTLSAITPGQKIHMPRRINEGGKASPAVDRQIRERLRAMPIESAERPGTLHRCTVDDLVALTEIQPYDEGDGWPSSNIVTVLRSIAPRFQERCFVYEHAINRADLVPRQGGLHKLDLNHLKSLDAPVLSLVFDPGKAGGPPRWTPSFLFPESMPTHVFNMTEST